MNKKLTFLCAHDVEIGHGRDDESAERAQSVRSHGVCPGGSCSPSATRFPKSACDASVLVLSMEKRASEWVTRRSLLLVLIAHTPTLTVQLLWVISYVLYWPGCVRALTGNSTSIVCGFMCFSSRGEVSLQPSSGTWSVFLFFKTHIITFFTATPFFVFPLSPKQRVCVVWT